MRKALLVLPLFLAGCGVSFEGKYIGSLTMKISCPGADPYTDVSMYSLEIEETATGIAIDMDSCGKLQGTVEGNKATIEQRTCPPTQEDGRQTTMTFKGGTLTLNGTSLNTNLGGDILMAGAEGSLNCTFLITGTLDAE